MGSGLSLEGEERTSRHREHAHRDDRDHWTYASAALDLRVGQVLERLGEDRAGVAALHSLVLRESLLPTADSGVRGAGIGLQSVEHLILPPLLMRRHLVAPVAGIDLEAPVEPPGAALLHELVRQPRAVL